MKKTLGIIWAVMKTVLEIIWAYLKGFAEGILMIPKVFFRSHPVKSVWEHYELIKDDPPLETKIERRLKRILWYAGRYHVSPWLYAIYICSFLIMGFSDGFIIGAIVYIMFFYLCIYRYARGVAKDENNRKEALKIVHPNLFQPSKFGLKMRKFFMFFF